MRTTQSLAACATCIYHSPPPSLPPLALFPTLSKKITAISTYGKVVCMSLPDTNSKQLVLAQIHGTYSIQQSVILCGKVETNV